MEGENKQHYVTKQKEWKCSMDLSKKNKKNTYIQVLIKCVIKMTGRGEKKKKKVVQGTLRHSELTVKKNKK